MNFPKVSIITLNWNGLKDTIECLESLKKIDYPNYETVVVDNGSTDGSPKEIEILFPGMVLIKNKENLGFAEGNNIGIRHALEKGSDYILLINNDTIVDTQILKSFLEAAYQYPDAGIFGGKIYYYSEKNKLWYAGAKLDSANIRFSKTGFNELDIHNKYNMIEETDIIWGAALFLRKEIPQKIGLLDKRFFLTFEETDWCYRAQKAGYKLLFVPKAKIWHKVSISFGGIESPLYAYFRIRNYLLFAKKNFHFSSQLNLYKDIIKSFFPHFFYNSQFPLLKRVYWDILYIVNHPTLFIANIMGMIDFILRRFGNCPSYIYKLNAVRKKS